MRGLLTQKEPPFILVILLAAFSWAISHVVTRTIDKPIVEVRSDTSMVVSDDILACAGNSLDKNRNEKVHTFTLTNISKDRLFNKLSFLVVATSGKIYGVRARAYSPAVYGDTPESCTNDMASFSDVTFHPGWKISLEVVTDINTDLSLRLNSAPKAVNLTECNIETWLVRNESSILFWFLGTVFVLAIYLVCISIRNNSELLQEKRNERKEGQTQ